MVFTKGATARLLEWASQKEKPVQKDFLDYLNKGMRVEEKMGITVMTGQLVEAYIRYYDASKTTDRIINQ